MIVIHCPLSIVNYPLLTAVGRSGSNVNIYCPKTDGSGSVAGFLGGRKYE